MPKDIPKRSILQCVYTEAERLEKRFHTGIDESENTKFETYAEHWLDRAAKRYKASTLAGTEKCWRWHTLILTVCRSAKSSPWFWRRWQKNSQAARAGRQASARSPLCCRMPQKITSCSPERVKYMNTASVLTFQKRGVSFICGLFAQSTLHWLSVNRIRRKNSNGAHPV